jgi:aryl-alcohol dehydrogenase-like predicted oxidoreductase
MHTDKKSRRVFLGAAAAGIAGVTMGLPAFADAGIAQTSSGGMKYRTLGRSGEKVSLLGLGGYHIGVQATEDESVRLIRTAVDSGINFLDNCWDYNNGQSEIRMGKALRDGYRQKVFLMTKIDGRTKEAAARQIDESLKRLQTDHIDLMQMHEVVRWEDPDHIFASGGMMEAMNAAKQAGKFRYMGFTGHKDPDIHLKMLKMCLAHGFTPDTVQMPLNIMDAHFKSFAHKVVPMLVEHKIGVLGMKPLASGLALKSKVVTPIECLHYAMNLPTSVVINGCDTMERLQQALEAVRTFEPLSKEQLSALLEKTAAAGAHGEFEPFKTSNSFDSTRQNPQWLG